MLPPSVKLGDVFRLSPNAYMLLDRELRYVAANEAYLRVTASRLEDLLGKHIFDAFPNDPSDPLNEPMRLLRASFTRVLATRKPDAVALIPYRVARERDGALEERYWSATHTPILDEQGEVAAILQHTVDVTELHALRLGRSEQVDDPVDALSNQVQAGVMGRALLVQAANTTLDEERRHLRSLFEQAPGFAAFLRGPDHVFAIANSAYFQLVGPRDILGKPVRDALPEVAGQGFQELLDEVFRTGKPYVGRATKVLVRRRPGEALTEVHIDFVYQPIIDARGVVSGIFVQGHDMSEQHRLEHERERLLANEKAAREEAERANRLKDDFLATVSHELRTPLTAMLGWVQMLRAGQIATEERRERALETIERNARAQAQLIEDLLDVSRIMAGKLKLDVESVGVAEVVEAALESARPAADAKELAIRTTLDASAQIMGDAARVQQIVWNLVTNAVKFTPRGGSVAVTVQRAGSFVEIVVADSGQGIDADFVEHVFEPFRQAEGTSTRKHGGLGLGLAIVKHLVELHGGTIEARSAGIGLGATFVVQLPIAFAPSRSDVGTVSTTRRIADDASFDCPPELAGLRVLVVDDEGDTRELLVAILERCGIHVHTAGSADEGLAAVRSVRPDVIISDIGMPGEDGYAFIRRVRALEGSGRTPAIALTAYARTEDRTRALLAGFKAHVPKPIDPGELIAVLVSLALSTAPA